ncbi:MAG: hypothetical protein ACXU8U_01880 [Asticcacaulis sp.]
MTDLPDTNIATEQAAYTSAQKMRNLYIGGALLLFVVLVFFVTMVRMSENMRNERAHKLSNQPLTAAASSSAS